MPLRRAIVFAGVVASLLASSTASFHPCPLLGPLFPAPASILDSSTVRGGLRSLTNVLDHAVDTGHTSHGPITPNATSFSISLFSTENAERSASPFFYEYHYTAPSLGDTPIGANQVDADSTYRIGDLTKLFTVWTFLVEAGDQHWHEPVTKYVPELARGPGASDDQTEHVAWDDVTVGQLASHMAGIGRDCSFDLANRDLDIDAYGLPPLGRADVPTCGHGTAMGRNEFLADFREHPPVVLPGTTPIYSNAAFQILGYVLEEISGEPFESMLNRSVTHPLGLTATTLHPPDDPSDGVRPAADDASGWNRAFGDESPSLSLFSSLTDVSRAGAAILSSTLLPPSMTRRWLKPVALTSNLANQVGMPWEIYSQARPATAPMTEIYTVFGGVGRYSSYIGLVPAYGVGFAILAAGADRRPDLNAHSDIVGDEVFPAIVQAAAEHAGAVYAGAYRDPAGTDSTFKVEVVDGLGLAITQLTRDGTDVRAGLAKLQGIKPDALSVRMYPTNLHTTSAGSGSAVVWRAVMQDMDAFADAGTPTCVSWMTVDKLRYGGEALDRLVFGIGEDGRANEVNVPALRMTLRRV